VPYDKKMTQYHHFNAKLYGAALIHH
jgi:hypothetical protein